MTEATEKACTKCGLTKPIAEFWISDKARGYRRGPCKACDKAYQKLQYARSEEFRAKALANSRKQALAKPRTAEQSRRYSLKHKFGLTHNGYETMLLSQNGKCALCSSTDGGRVGTKGKWKSNHFNVDHDHTTGRVRGLLCHKCNVRVGAYEGLLAEVGIHKLVAYLSGASPDAPPPAPG